MKKEWVPASPGNCLVLRFPVPAIAPWPAAEGFILIEPRPRYCDRGNFIAKIFTADIDGQDYWPRYYFSLDVAKSECEAFVEKRYERKN